jgi:CTP:molybdopterin cytidylyltransferase MocA
MTRMSGQRGVTAVVLAAGASSRFGSPKQLAPFAGGTMLDAVLETARAAGLDPIIAVVGADIPLPARVLRVTNDDPSAGLSRSLQLGVAAVPADTAAIILLGDQPTVTPRQLRDLIRRRGSSRIVATEADGILAPPVLLEPDAFPLADRARGDRGLREILRSVRHEVSVFDLPRHAPDVDTPADLEALAEPCPGCGARFAPSDSTETHEYIGASPACWAAFGELLAREFGDPAYGSIHRHTVDVYTVQHPGRDERRERQSVALHLIGLCHWLEHDLGMMQLNTLTQRLASERREWPWLPPPPAHELTVLDALAARDAAAHARIVRSWAESTWAAWEPHHEVIRRWAVEALG